MSAQDILLEEIKHPPEPLLRELRLYLDFMRKKQPWVLFICFVATSNLSGQRSSPEIKQAASAITYVERPIAAQHVRPGGILGDRIKFNLDMLIRERNIRHALYSGWGADQIGRWLGATTIAQELFPAKVRSSAIQEKVSELISVQATNGFYYAKELEKTPERLYECWFGQGRGIWSLYEYYKFTGNEKARASATKAADFVMNNRKSWKISKPLCGGIESALDPIAAMGFAWDRPDYIDWSKYIADNIQHQVGHPSDEPTAHVESNKLHTHEEKPFYHHTYSYLNTMHGVLDLAVLTGEKKYLEIARDVFDNSLSSVWINGQFPESYGDYYERCDEQCSGIEWLELSLKLFGTTGDARYLDWAELTAMNQLFFGQIPNAGFTCYRSINRHHWMSKDNHGGEQGDCCTMSGGFGMSLTATYTVTSNDRGLSVNLPFDVDVKKTMNGGAMHLTQTIEVQPYEMVRRIQAKNDSLKAIDVKVHAPYWSPKPMASVNGKNVSQKTVKGFITFKCLAGESLSIDIRLPMNLAVVPARRSILNANQPDGKHGAVGDATEVGLMYGPYTLMFNREMAPQVTIKDLSLNIPVDRQGHPKVSQTIPQNWKDEIGALPLFIDATLQDGTAVQLIPCANFTQTALTVTDPYVMRFSEIKLTRSLMNR